MIPEVLSIAFFLVLTITFSFKNKLLPPGPSGLPIIGFLHKLGSKPLHLLMSDLGDKYGDIFSLQLGSRLTIILHSKEAIYEAFVKKAKMFAGRPDLATFNKTRHGATGISMCDYSDKYKQNRQRTVKVMHHFFSDKTKFNQILENEAHKMIQLFTEKSNNDEIFNPSHEFHKIVPNIMVNAMFGKNSPYTDSDVVNLVELNKKWFKSAEGSNPADFLKILERFPNKRLDAIEQSCMAFYDFSFKKMKEFENEECSGLYGTYARLFKESLGKDELNDKEKFELGRWVNDMLGGGFDTLASILSWSFLFLSSSPDIASKCRQEMQDIVRDENVGICHQKELKYCNAVIYELLRLCSVAPLGLPRKTMQEVKIRDFIIPKDTMVMANLWSANNDKSLWKNTDKFHPENFLDHQGEFDHTAVRKLASFSYGVRRCPGEKFAVNQLFVMLMNFLRQFEFEVVKQPQDMLPQGGLTLQPKPYFIKVNKL